MNFFLVGFNKQHMAAGNVCVDLVYFQVPQTLKYLNCTKGKLDLSSFMNDA